MVTNPFDDVIARAPRETWLDELAHASLKAAQAKFFPADRPESLLTVSLDGESIAPWEAATVSIALQDATAKIGKLIADPRSEHLNRRIQNRDDVPLISRGSAGRRLYFGFPRPAAPAPGVDPLMPIFEPSLSERAVRELISILPRGASDDVSLDALVARRPTERSAVSDLVDAISTVANGITLNLSAGDDVVEENTSTLTLDQAAVLKDSFAEVDTTKEIRKVPGVIDGMRSSRRVFYLDTDDGRTINGAIGTDMIDDVKDAIGRHVTATVEASTIRNKAGRRGRTVYQLISLDVDQTLI